MNKPAVPKKPSAIRTGFAETIDMPMSVPDNMSAIKTADMTFKMPPAWHSRFKATASMHRMSMKELLVASFEAWEREQQGK